MGRNLSKFFLVKDSLFSSHSSSYVFYQASTTEGLGSAKAEVMADTSVALATANVHVVSSKLINRLLMVSCCLFSIFFSFFVHDLYWTSRKNSSELIELSSINKVSLEKIFIGSTRML